MIVNPKIIIVGNFSSLRGMPVIPIYVRKILYLVVILNAKCIFKVIYSFNFNLESIVNTYRVESLLKFETILLGRTVI